MYCSYGTHSGSIVFFFSKIQLTTANLIRTLFQSAYDFFSPLKLWKGCGLHSRIYRIFTCPYLSETQGKIISTLRRLIIFIFTSQRADYYLNTNDVNTRTHASTKVIRNRRINCYVKTSGNKSKPDTFFFFTNICYSAWSETVACVVCLHLTFYSNLIWLKVGFSYHYVEERVKIGKIRKKFDEPVAEALTLYRF